MSENTALIRFLRGFEPDGVSKDGLPAYRSTIKIEKTVPPATKLEYFATEDDFEEFRDEYQAFLRTERSKGGKVEGIEGYPLALWPACDGAILAMCAAREIYTVEQLAKIAKRKDLPGDVAELADRAAQMVEHQKNIGKFEAIVRQKDGEIAALLEQVRELRSAVSGRDALIGSLQSMQQYARPAVNG